MQELAGGRGEWSSSPARVCAASGNSGRLNWSFEAETSAGLGGMVAALWGWVGAVFRSELTAHAQQSLELQSVYFLFRWVNTKMYNVAGLCQVFRHSLNLGLKNLGCV